MSLSNELVDKLSTLQIDVYETDYTVCGSHLEASLTSDQVRVFAQNMLEQGFYLVFVTAVHITPQFQIVYQFAHFEYPCRVVAKTFASDDGAIPTISDIFHGANWHERETRDFYGITFTGHPDLRTFILCEEDRDLKPLLKRENILVGLDGITRKAVQETDTKATPSTPSPE